MYKKGLIVIAFLVSSYPVALYIYLSNERSFFDEGIHLSCSDGDKHLLEIEVVGDSWVVREGVVEGLISSLNSVDGLRVTKQGKAGATSKDVLEKVIYNSKEYGMAVDIVVVVAGVNDLSSSFGEKFYAHHLTELIKEYNNCGVFPIVLSLPEFGVEETFAKRPLPNRLLKGYFAQTVFDDGVPDARENYVNALRDKLAGTDYSYLLLNSNDFINSYEESIDQFENPSHLTVPAGYRLGRFIGERLLSAQLDSLRE